MPVPQEDYREWSDRQTRESAFDLGEAERDRHAVTYALDRKPDPVPLPVLQPPERTPEEQSAAYTAGYRIGRQDRLGHTLSVQSEWDRYQRDVLGPLAEQIAVEQCGIVCRTLTEKALSGIRDGIHFAHRRRLLHRGTRAADSAA